MNRYARAAAGRFGQRLPPRIIKYTNTRHIVRIAYPRHRRQSYAITTPTEISCSNCPPDDGNGKGERIFCDRQVNELLFALIDMYVRARFMSYVDFTVFALFQQTPSRIIYAVLSTLYVHCCQRYMVNLPTTRQSSVPLLFLWELTCEPCRRCDARRVLGSINSGKYSVQTIHGEILGQTFNQGVGTPDAHRKLAEIPISSYAIVC